MRVPGLEVGRDPCVERRQLGDAFPDGRQARQHGAVRLVENRVGISTQALQPLGVGEDRPGGGELLIFGGLQVGSLAISSRWNVSRSMRAAFWRSSSRSAARSRRTPLDIGETLADAPALAARPAIVVEEVEMGLGIGKDLVLVLTVELDQPLGEVPERAGGGQRAIDERAASPLRGDLASDDDFATLAIRTAPRFSLFLRPSARGRSRRGRRAAGPTASTRIDLPAPVSPVSTFRPASKSTSTDSMTARFRMLR